MLPPCYLNRDIFSEESSPGLHEEEREAIFSEDKETPRKNFSEDVAAVMRVLKMTLTMNDEVAESQVSLDKVFARI